MEEATASDVKNVERLKMEEERDRLLENDSIRRAVYQFPNEPIIRYSWVSGRPGRTEILYQEAQDILRATRYSIVKPTALIPDFLPQPQPDLRSFLRNGLGPAVGMSPGSSPESRSLCFPERSRTRLRQNNCCQTPNSS